MITLYQFARTWGSPNLSLFCIKVETYLRMARLPYRIVETLPPKAPRGKLPYLVDGDRTISDSRLILHYLQSTYGDPLDADLSADQKAVARAFQRLIEEHLYWVTMYTRWNTTEANWQHNKQAIFGGLPAWVRNPVAWLYRFRIRSQIRGHGIGRLTPEEVFALGQEDVDAMADFLGRKPFFLGERATSIDASAYAVLVVLMECPIESPVKDHALAKPNLVAYCRRMRAEYFSDLGILRDGPGS